VTPESATFEDHVLSIVDRFLQTVIVVDDRAFTEPVYTAVESEEEAVEAPGGRAVHGEFGAPPLDEHDLDAKKVTDAFARSGLICGLLQPRPGADIDDELIESARRADLIVLDWVLNRDEGRKALELIRRLLDGQGAQPEIQRLRTIAIYTGQPNLLEIAAKLHEVIEKIYEGEELREYDDGLTLMKGPVRIAVFAKENTSDLRAELEDRRVPFDGLPARMRREFGALTKGLVTVVALSALAALREDTHRILKVLNENLDAAYLGHRSVLPVPSDAQSHAVSLISAEFTSVIEDHNIGEQVNWSALSLWLDQAGGDDHNFGKLLELSGDRKPITIDQVREMVSRGLGTDEGLDAVAELGGTSKGQWKQIKKQAARIFASTLEDADESEAQLAQCLTLKTTYTHPERMLQLGTIVAHEGDYLVCVQPVCDSVRLKPEVRAFPFLKLEKSDRSRSHFALPRAGANGPQYVLLTTNPRDLVVARFKPQAGHDTICAVQARREYVFKDTSHRPFRWVGQLKSEFAQKVAVDLAQEFAQVAVNEVEVLRLARR